MQACVYEFKGGLKKKKKLEDCESGIVSCCDNVIPSIGSVVEDILYCIVNGTH